MSEIMKECACGRSFTEDEWLLLPFVGKSGTDDGDPDPIVIELRNCPCGSTIAIECA